MYYTGQYITGTSFIYRLDPRIKLVAVVTLSMLILAANQPAVIFIGFCLVLLIFLTSMSWRLIWQSLQPLLFFIALIFLVHVLFTEGDIIFSISCLRISASGLAQGFSVSERFLCLIIAAILLTMTTQPSRIIAALTYILRPLKRLRVPVDDIAVMIMLAMRLMPILLSEKERIEIAQIARGYSPKRSGFVLRIKGFLFLVTSVLLGVFKRADMLAMAMEARNYRCGPRTSAVELRLARIDFIAIIYSVIFFVIFIALNLCFG
jgi:energy-coupling factor transport system permease protein